MAQSADVQLRAGAASQADIWLYQTIAKTVPSNDIWLYRGQTAPADIGLRSTALTAATSPQATGEADGASTLTAAVTGSIGAAGEADGTSTLAAAVGGSIPAAGEADGAGTAATAATGTIQAAGASGGVGAASAVVTGSAPASVASAGSGTAAATVGGGVQAAGAAVGTSTAAVAVSGATQAAGVAPGTSTASVTIAAPQLPPAQQPIARPTPVTTKLASQIVAMPDFATAARQIPGLLPANTTWQWISVGAGPSLLVEFIAGGRRGSMMFLMKNGKITLYRSSIQ